MTPSRPILPATYAWRPMAYGSIAPHRIANPICEPLWGGRRVLIEVAAGRVTIRDTEAIEVDGYGALREAISDASLARELVLDGCLLPAPLRDTEGARVPLGTDAIETPGARVRHMFLGGSMTARRRKELRLADERRAPSPGSQPAAFVAIDLLWIDRQSLLDIPLQERKRILESALDERELVRRTVAVRPPVETWFAQWRALGFEEVVFKAANGRYLPGTVSRDWTIKTMPRR